MKLIDRKLLVVFPLLFSGTIALAAFYEGDAAAGKAIYDGKGACAACHGATGEGDGVAAAGLNPKPASFATASFKLDGDGDGKMGTIADIANVIKNGAAKYGGAATMPPRPDLSDKEISDMAAYILSLKK